MFRFGVIEIKKRKTYYIDVEYLDLVKYWSKQWGCSENETLERLISSSFGMFSKQDLEGLNATIETLLGLRSIYGRTKK